MRAVIQRVKSASVTVDGKLISKIGPGLCVLIGISRDDKETDSDWIMNKILKLCLFDNIESGRRWSSNVVDRQLEILCVSQFTLYATMKGNKLDFHHSMESTTSRIVYECLLDKMRRSYDPLKIHDGLFGAFMALDIVNDGPVTINIESPQSPVEKQKSNDGNKS
ncbi:D-aminoacyl-tRNA deacylase [Dermatophagoides farinae]|uniref:D-aminoacyl-tRNA deacylase n=1 Tax=Dermatophagoides farinae TaxID=6954 RepID=A0A922I5C2_DERFA|nr:D-aminoacyl-tRNA deacylase-like [Dermatophagoides farinae]KAH7641757.1 d-tyrosyl-trna deacylase 1-like protein [Dermatophagoides farinae]KAH9518251.1 D-tyrosyl-tRNA(Tyr) deacylase [Dermatophagoides farinae]